MPYPLADLAPDEVAFHPYDVLRADVERACAEHPGLATCHVIGHSEEGRPLVGVVLGSGPRAVSLVAGHHADEPVGPETLRAFVVEGLARAEHVGGLFERYRFLVVPHANPDGAARNRRWIEQWPSVEAYLEHRVREQPGRDLEFGFPAMRPENRAVAAFLKEHVPQDKEHVPAGGLMLHVSLHGMGFSEGAMLLIERHWTHRTQALRDGFCTAARAAGLGLHDHNRKGEKGFFYVEPGFTTTPEGAAMRAYFRARRRPAMADKFHGSSMEHVRSLGGDPLCLVTELPLFVIEGDAEAPADAEAPPGVPARYLAFRERLGAGDEAAALAGRFGLRPLPLDAALRLQLHVLELGLEAASDAPEGAEALRDH